MRRTNLSYASGIFWYVFCSAYFIKNIFLINMDILLSSILSTTQTCYERRLSYDSTNFLIIFLTCHSGLSLLSTIKGWKVSEGVFNLSTFSKKPNQISNPKVFNLNWNLGDLGTASFENGAKLKLPSGIFHLYHFQFHHQLQIHHRCNLHFNSIFPLIGY